MEHSLKVNNKERGCDRFREQPIQGSACPPPNPVSKPPLTMSFPPHSGTDEPKTLYIFQSSFYDARDLPPSARQGFNANLSLLLWFQLT